MPSQPYRLRLVAARRPPGPGMRARYLDSTGSDVKRGASKWRCATGGGRSEVAVDQGWPSPTNGESASTSPTATRPPPGTPSSAVWVAARLQQRRCSVRAAPLAKRLGTSRQRVLRPEGRQAVVVLQAAEFPLDS